MIDFGVDLNEITSFAVLETADSYGHLITVTNWAIGSVHHMLSGWNIDL